MRINKAVITAAGRNQRSLPLQTLIDRDGEQKSVLEILVDEAVSAAVDQVAVVVIPGDEVRYAEVLHRHEGVVRFIAQERALGYGHAVYCARGFVGDDPFLHLVGDHLYVSREKRTCAQQLVSVAESEACAVSAVQATRETLLPYYGTVGGRRVPGRKDLYAVESVAEKPTPTQAEMSLIVPGLRAGHYLCFFGMHVLTPAVMEILGRLVDASTSGAPAKPKTVALSDALAELAQQEKYLALEEHAQRYDVGVKYGLLTAQLALALTGRDREEVLSRLVELLSVRELGQDLSGVGA
ncbi:MAG: sugar phosphate nucleotidyltransferase [Anaerolineae bacterium]|jgi:UTP--glucose-1-phosphate uridylyltransferase|nr:sugar phosphate nucleotidyltransferase [Anaerolineae bacterium]